MVGKVIYLIYLLGVPLAVMNLARRWRWIDRVSPMTVLYVIGLLVANTTPVMAILDVNGLNEMVGNLAVPLALPMMLLGCNLRSWSTSKAAKAFLTGLVAVMLSIVAGFFLFRNSYTKDEFAQICAVVTGLYTGGIPNISAIAKGVGISNELFLYITSYDLIVTGLYLVFIIFFGKTVFRGLLPQQGRQKEVVPTSDETLQHSDYKEEKVIFPFDRSHWRQSLMVIGTTVVIAAVSYIVALLAGGEGINMTGLILMLTTLAIVASFLPAMRRQESAFDMGLYCVYVFCFTIANGCDVREMNLMGSLNILALIVFVIFGSLTLQVLLARLLHIDGDTVMVSSVALINSPPFVPMAAALLGNKDVMMTGICVGLLGYMVGNYLGIGIFLLLGGG